MNDAVILFSVKDKDLFGMSNQYIAECYVAFSGIAPADQDGSREQIHLKLSRPTLSGMCHQLVLPNFRDDNNNFLFSQTPIVFVRWNIDKVTNRLEIF